MALRSNHYDAALEAYLRELRTPHVVVDEARRSLFQQASLKSMDFIVHSSRSTNLLVDVKGRRFPSGLPLNRRKWENWTTEEDIRSLLDWEQVFGEGFRAMLVFAYDVVDERCLKEFGETFEFRQRRYAFYGVWASEYQRGMRRRSASWETVFLPGRVFRKLRLPFSEFL